VHVGEAGPVQRVHGRGAAHAVHRGERDAQGARRAARQPRHPFQIGVGHIGLGRRRGRRDRDGGGRRRDGGFDLGVGWRSELGAVGEVDLVAVVGRRVVRRRDLYACHGAQLTHREREHRRGQRAGQHPHREPGAGQHLGRRRRERR
jgi:hypothetical protein